MAPNRAEQDAGKFFRLGMKKEKIAGQVILVRPPLRVGIIKHWPNVQFSDEKMIDYTGVLYGGLGFAVESKMHLVSAGRFAFSQISARQRSFLDQYIRLGARAYLWLQFIHDLNRRCKDDAAFLIPWDEWAEMEGKYLRVFKNGSESKPYKSITLENTREFFSQHELFYTKKGLWWHRCDLTDSEGTTLIYIPQPILVGECWYE